jgi:SEC-C motif-containing protein
MDGGVGDLEGTVAFEARHSEGFLRELSFFQRRGGCIDGDWLYIKALNINTD